MKFVCYTVKTVYPPVIEGGDERVKYFAREIPCCNSVSVDDAIEIAKRESYNGEYTIEDDGKPEPAPTQLDRIEAQTTYTAMMTDTLMEG